MGTPTVATPPPAQGATFVPVTNCPANPDLPECTAQTACGDLCEADQPLPDGNMNYDINNCGGYDVFQKTCGGQETSAEPTPTPCSNPTTCTRCHFRASYQLPSERGSPGVHCSNC